MATLQELENAKLVTIDNLSAVKTYIDENKVQAIEFSLRVDEDGYLICDYPEGTEPEKCSPDKDGGTIITRLPWASYI